MEQALVEYILKQHAEADAWMAANPGSWMGKLVDPSDTEYWTQRVPSGTLKEYQRIELEEDAYYTLSEAYSKSYARAHDFRNMTDAELMQEIESASQVITREIESEKAEKAQEEERLEELASSLSVDRETLDRWMEAA